MNFAQGLGRWAGTAEVYSGAGRFLGNATDTRHAHTQIEDGRIRLDVSFVGPFKFAGHYVIQDQGDHRLYQGPANVGYAETLSVSLVDANAYWAAVGLSQRFWLMVLPGGNIQISLGLMSRGEHLKYVVVGQYNRVLGDGPAAAPALVDGAACDLTDDPTAGRGEVLLHRPGVWSGELTVLDGERQPQGTAVYRETIEGVTGQMLTVTTEGHAFDPERRSFPLTTNGWEAWTRPDQPVMGSYSLSGGRALSGHFHHLDAQMRVWRREAVTHDGARKAVVHTWYRGGERVGVQFGVLGFQAGG